jgi:RHS repeat-associated protein
VVQKSYVWGLDISESSQGAGGVGGLISVVVTGEAYQFLYDANGNVGQLVKSSDGTIAAHYEYDPFGVLLKSSGSMANENPFRFSTKYYDTETDLYYYGYRYYSTNLGRWINRDPSEEKGAVGNLYLFIYNDAINDVDVLGLKSLDEIEQQYRKIISRGRLRGWNVAADNLQHFLDGGDNRRKLSWSWLRKFNSVLRAERKNRERFINRTLKDKIRKYKSGVIEVLDWWDSQEKASVSTELYFASGSFTLTSYGKFELSCVKGGKIRVKGSIDHYWWDIYDWHAGLFAAVPTFGNVSDADALALKNAGRAANYYMDSTWYDTIDVQLEKNKFSASDFKWRGPSGGTSGAKAAVISKYPSSIPATLRPWLK